MKALYPALITLAIILPLPIHAQIEVGRPAASNVPGRQYPYIYSDRRVTFRVKAPEAKRVQVVGRMSRLDSLEQSLLLIKIGQISESDAKRLKEVWVLYIKPQF